MGMDLSLYATVECELFLNNGKRKPYTIIKYFDLMSIGTKVTKKILNIEYDADKINAYKEWVMSNCSEQEIENIEGFDENMKPIIKSIEIYNPSLNHLLEFSLFFQTHAGWDFKWFAT